MTSVIIANIVLCAGVFIVIVGLLASSMLPSARSRSAALPIAWRLLGHTRPQSGGRAFRADTQST